MGEISRLASLSVSGVAPLKLLSLSNKRIQGGWCGLTNQAPGPCMYYFGEYAAGLFGRLSGPTLAAWGVGGPLSWPWRWLLVLRPSSRRRFRSYSSLFTGDR